MHETDLNTYLVADVAHLYNSQYNIPKLSVTGIYRIFAKGFNPSFDSLIPSLDLFPWPFWKAFQNRNVSSPAPVVIVCPSGLMARYKTRIV